MKKVGGNGEKRLAMYSSSSLHDRLGQVLVRGKARH